MATIHKYTVQESTNLLVPRLIEVTPTIVADDNADNDVAFNWTKISNASIRAGEATKLVSVSIYDPGVSLGDFELFFCRGSGTDGTAPGATIDFTPLDYCDLTPANRTGQNPWSNTIRFCLPHDNERAIDILPQQESLPGLEGRAPPNTNQGDGSRGGLGGIAIYTD